MSNKKIPTKTELNKTISELKRDLKYITKDEKKARNELLQESKKVSYLEELCGELKSYIYRLEQEVPHDKRQEMSTTYPDDYDINKINKYLNR